MKMLTCDYNEYIGSSIYGGLQDDLLHDQATLNNALKYPEIFTE
jgi:hypothetical protein